MPTSLSSQAILCDLHEVLLGVKQYLHYISTEGVTGERGGVFGWDLFCEVVHTA